MFTCTVCKGTFPSRAALSRHKSKSERCVTKHRPVFACTQDGCLAQYNRKDFLSRHEFKVHGMHRTKRDPGHNRIQLPAPSADTVQKVPGIREPIITKSVILNVTHPERNTVKFFKTLRPSLCKILSNAVQQHQHIMFDISLDAKMLQTSENSDGVFEVKTFFSKDIALRSLAEVEHTIDVIIQLIVAESFDEIQKSELNEILQLEISISKLRRQMGGYMPVHPEILSTKAVVNVKNSDAYCFKWAIFAGLSHPTDNILLLTFPHSYEISDIREDKIYYSSIIVDFSGLSFPMEVRNMVIFEENNPAVSVNVFGADERGKIVGPLYRTLKERARHVNLLYYENEKENTCHYAWIKSLPRLLRKQLGEENTLLEVCNSCLTYFTTRELFEAHKDNPANCDEP